MLYFKPPHFDLPQKDVQRVVFNLEGHQGCTKDTNIYYRFCTLCDLCVLPLSPLWLKIFHSLDYLLVGSNF